MNKKKKQEWIKPEVKTLDVKETMGGPGPAFRDSWNSGRHGFDS
ncbi:paeninodin family lasso peptide [Sporolactobacillus sp. THM7-4]|nr:paeninodin family lasso peptide [Sporolactobacillus sp. THM7-4]